METVSAIFHAVQNLLSRTFLSFNLHSFQWNTSRPLSRVRLEILTSKPTTDLDFNIVEESLRPTIPIEELDSAEVNIVAAKANIKLYDEPIHHPFVSQSSSSMELV